MERLGGYTEQSRGQRFNYWLAEMFRAWGHRSRAELNARGNIDVALAIASQRYILEAKWERPPIAIGPIAKLQKRIRQRLGGTIGVLVSMSGYTPPALADLKDGERLEVILLDRSHVEGMLSGCIPPDEMFDGLLDRAHFYGDPTASIELALGVIDPPPVLRVRPFPIGDETPVTSALAGIRAEWVVRDIPGGQSGLGVMRDGSLIIAGGDGVVTVGLSSGTVTRVPGAPRDISGVKVLESGAIAMTRRYGVAVLESGSLRFVAGPLPGRLVFVENTGNELVVLSNGHPMERGSRPCVCHIRSGLGDEEIYDLDFPSGSGAGGVQIRDGRLIVIGSPLRLFDDKGCTTLNVPLSNPFTAAVMSNGNVVLGGGNVDLCEVDVDGGTTKHLCSLKMHGAIVVLATDPNTHHIGYVLAHEDVNGVSLGAVVKVEFSSVEVPRR